MTTLAVQKDWFQILENCLATERKAKSSATLQQGEPEQQACYKQVRSFLKRHLLLKNSLVGMAFAYVEESAAAVSTELDDHIEICGNKASSSNEATSSTASLVCAPLDSTDSSSGGDRSGGEEHTPLPSWPDLAGEGEQQPPEATPDKMSFTSLIVRNIPWCYTQDELLLEWHLEGEFDFFHLPYSSYLGRHLGVAIINFIVQEKATTFRESWQGQKLRRHPYKKSLSVGKASQQGRHANLCMVQDDAPVLPAVRLGDVRLEEKEVIDLVSMARAGVELCRV